jgi:hypothetical protein
MIAYERGPTPQSIFFVSGYIALLFGTSYS